MKTILPGKFPPPPRTLVKLRARLAEAEETLRAIRAGEVDAVVVAGKHGPQVFTLEGAEDSYRALIESMNEGALTFTADKTILYANQCFARMVKCPLEQVIGGSFRRFLSAGDRTTLRRLLKRPGKSGTKIQMPLKACDGSQLPVQISFRPLAKDGPDHAAIGMVVTDMTEARRSEDMLRTLTHRVVRAQEAERGRMARELHDTITQSLCAVVIRSQVLANGLSSTREARGGTAKAWKAAKAEAVKLCGMLGKTVEEVERISRNLRPSVLDHLGLIAGLRAAGAEFADRTGVSVEVACVEPAPRLPADTELALYRILQEALRNVEKHARARHVTVRLTKQRGLVRLAIRDDGIGFDPGRHPAGRKGKGGLGLLGMRERATSVGGALKVKSTRRAGTEIDLRIPPAPAITTAATTAAAGSPIRGKIS